MSDPAAMHERRARHLERLTELGMALVDQIQADAMAAEPKERAELAIVFHRVARGVRQTMALAERLERLRPAPRARRPPTARRPAPPPWRNA